MIDATKLVKKSDTYSIISDGGITDENLIAVAKDYRKNVTRNYSTVNCAKIDSVFTNQDTVTSIKYDGIGMFLIFVDNKVTIFSVSGRVLIGLPAELELAAKFKKDGITKALFAIELYLKGEEGCPRTQVGDVIHAIFSKDTALHNRLAIAAYDILMVDGKDYRKEDFVSHKFVVLNEIFGSKYDKKFHAVEGWHTAGNKVSEKFQQVTANNKYEGIVVRYGNSIAKIKPAITIDCVVIGYASDEDGLSNILVGLTSGKHIQAIARVSGFNDNQKLSLIEHLRAIEVSKNPIAMVDGNSRQIKFVQPSIVVEIEGESLMPENFDGKTNKAQGFNWDGSEYVYSGMFEIPLVVHAKFSRVREDKNWNDGGTRITQVISESEVQNYISKPIIEVQPRIITQKIFVKKGALRKAIIIERSRNFVLVWTDFSPNRADKLNQKTFVASTIARINEIADSLYVEGRKKGWEEVI